MTPRGPFPSHELPDFDGEALRALARKLGLPWPSDDRIAPGEIGFLTAAWNHRHLDADEILELLDRAADVSARERRIRHALDDDRPGA